LRYQKKRNPENDNKDENISNKKQKIEQEEGGNQIVVEEGEKKGEVQKETTEQKGSVQQDVRVVNPHRNRTYPKKRVVVLFCYCGENYAGLQRLINLLIIVS
jgi:hypothetical protein